ncbi:unnamed protein product [Lymnaea stagnalis]|uniref:Uncharacterized protein n=1 Tax=Lymnaea stagnalis TaxID=6523 RepID=A0AAV2IMP1_LYMST
MLLHFKQNEIILITSKSAGDNTKLWGGEVKGKRGYFDKGFVRELTVYVAEPQYLVDTEVNTFGKLGKPPPARRDKEVERKPVEPDIEKEEQGQNKATTGEAKVDIPEPRVPPAKEKSPSPVLEVPEEKGAEKVHDSKEGNLSSAESHPRDEDGRPGDESPRDISGSEAKQRYEQEETQKEESEEEEEHQVVNEEDWEALDNDYFETERDRYDTSDLNQFVFKKFSSKASQEDQTVLKDAPEESSKAAPEESSEDAPDVLSKDAPDVLSKDAPDVLSKDAPDELSQDASEESSKDALEESSKDAPEESSKDAPEESSKDVPDMSKDAPDELSKDATEESSKEALDESSEDEEKPSAETSQEKIVPHPLRHTESSRDKESTEGSDLSDSEEDPDDASENNFIDESNDKEESDLEFEPEDRKISLKKSPKLKEAEGDDSGGVKMFAMEDEEEDSIGADLPMYDPNSPAAGDSRTGTDKTETVEKLPGSESGPSKLVSAGSTEEPPTASVDQDNDQGKHNEEVEDEGEIAKNETDELRSQKEKNKEFKSKTSSYQTESNSEIDADRSKRLKSAAEDSDEGGQNKMEVDDSKNEKKLGHILKESQVFSYDDREEKLKEKTLELPKETVSGESLNTEMEHILSRKLKDESSSDTDFDVRPDTPSGESPEQAQVSDTTLVDQDQVSSSKAENIQDGEHEGRSPEPELNGSSQHPSSHRLASDPPGEAIREPLKEAVNEPTDDHEEPSDPVDLEYFKKDETRNVGGGFADFLQASASEPQHTDHGSVTPELDSLPRVSESGESVANSGTSAIDIHSTSTMDHKEETTGSGEDLKPQAAKGSIETIIEGESTILFDADGNFITAIMKEDPQSQTAASVQPSQSSLAVESVGSSQVNPTPVDSIPKPSVTSRASDKKVPEDNRETPLHSSRKEGSLNGSDPLSDLDSGGSPFLDSPVNEVYQSSDFSSRKVLSLNQQPPTPQQQKPASPEISPRLDTSKPTDVAKSGVEEQLKSDIVKSLDDLPQEAVENKEEAIVPDEQPIHLPEEENKDHLHVEQTESSTQNPEEIANSSAQSPEEIVKSSTPSPEEIAESSTQSPEEISEIPPPPTFREPSGSDDQAGQEYLSDNTYHSRKINDEELYTKEEEELTKASPGFAKTIMTFVEGCAKAVVDKLPHSLQSLLELEPIGLSPNMTVIATFFSLILLVIISLTSGCSSNGKKQKLKATLDVIQELEAKLQLAVKEKENIEDRIKESQIENTKLKEEMSKQKKDSGKSNSELQTIQLHSESLKKQVAALENELKELKENSNSKIGEAKQTSKKAKELEKTLKKLEEREKKLEQENQKLISDLRHKEGEVVSLTSKVGGLTEQIGHLETRKDQLLSEAEDWKEKVSDLNERLEQREEEFKQMQENIMFKDNELEVLKDCFLQLKSFEEEEAEDGEDRGEDGSLRVQEKLNSMMDVSKVNAALRAIEEEKDILANRLKIESEARKELEEQLENSRRSVESSTADKMKAERQCQEAQTKLTVLSNYFKDKELQLQRELGEHEAQKKHNLNKLVSADETTRSFQQELDIVRTQNESLKRELASSERDFRSQIAANEKKAHDNWLAARAAERELKEARHEAGVLRQKLTDIERRQFMGPGGLIRPLPTRGLPPPGMMNGPPPPGMDRSPSRGSLPPLLPPHLRDEEFMNSIRSPMELRRGPPPPPGMRQHPDARSPPLPPFRDGRSPPPRMPPPGMLDGRSPPPYDRRPPPPPHMLDRRSPPFRLPPPDMLPPPPMRGGPLPPPHFNRGSPSSGTDSPHLDRPDGRYPPPYARNPPFPSDRPSPRGGAPPRQQQSQV